MRVLDGKVAIVTGAASGIGACSAAMFAREGASVMVADVNLDGAEKQTQAIRAAGGLATAVHVDLGDAESVRQMIETTVRTYGKLNVLFNNAAATHLSLHQDFDIEHTDIGIWDDSMRINVRGTMLAIKHAIPHLRAQGGGSIINTSSGSGIAGDLTRTAYGVSKGAIIVLTQYAATQYGKEGIRCNAILPGLILTPAARAFFEQQKEIAEITLSHHLTPRLGEPEDIAAMATFLASDAAAFVTGQAIQVDGGNFAHQPFYADFRRLAEQHKA